MKVGLAIAIAAIILSALAAWRMYLGRFMAAVARSKGYHGHEDAIRRVCCFGGLFGALIVVAMPDLKTREEITLLRKALEQARE